MTHHHPKHPEHHERQLRRARVAFIVVGCGLAALSVFTLLNRTHNAKLVPALTQQKLDAIVADASERAHQRREAATWPGLSQVEINALTRRLEGVEDVVIFCENDAYCGDLQLDFDNALESAHWSTKLEKPFIDTTVGISTSSPALADAINQATHGRIIPKIIEKTAPYFALVIGHRVGKQAGITVVPMDGDVSRGLVINSEPPVTVSAPDEHSIKVTVTLPDEKPPVVAEQPAETVAEPVAPVTAPVEPTYQPSPHVMRGPRIFAPEADIAPAFPCGFICRNTFD